MYKTKTQVRNSFWQMLKEFHPELYAMKRTRKTQNEYNATIRTEFCFYVDMLCKNSEISEKLANNITL